MAFTSHNSLKVLKDSRLGSSRALFGAATNGTIFVLQLPAQPSAAPDGGFGLGSFAGKVWYRGCLLLWPSLSIRITQGRFAPYKHIAYSLRESPAWPQDLAEKNPFASMHLGLTSGLRDFE